MFDIGFAELVIIGVVALLVIGPERLPATIRTATLYLNRIRRGFNEIKQEVQQELHNDAVMQDLRDTGNQLKQEAQALGKEINSGSDAFKSSIEQSATTAPADTTPDNATPEDEVAQGSTPKHEQAAPAASSQTPQRDAQSAPADGKPAE